MDVASNRKRMLGLGRAGVAGWCVLCAVQSLPATAKTFDEVEKDLIAKYDKIKSYTAKSASKQDMDIGEGNKMKSDSTGTIEWMRRGDKVLYRMEMKGTSEMLIANQETKSKSAVLAVSDGEFVHTLNDTDGQKSAMKTKVDPAQSSDNKAMFALWKKE